MAITINKSPLLFNPAGNQNIWQVTSDNTNIQYFRVSIIQAGTTSVISNIDIYTTPDYVSGAYINIKNILQNLVSCEVDIDNTSLVTYLDDEIFSYRLKIVERVYDSTSDSIIDGDSYDETADAYYVWYAMMDRIGFDNYYLSDYVVQIDNKAKFLTTRPDLVEVNDYSTEFLYFLSDGSITSLNAFIKTYDSSNTLLTTYSTPVPNADTKNMFRIYCSPDVVKDWVTSMDNVVYYLIGVEDSNGNAVIEERKYLYKKLDCSLQPINILFSNTLGGIDSYQFVNPVKSIDVTKTTIIKNPYRLDASGNYTDKIGSIYNAVEEIINVSSKITYTATSRPLSDTEAEWLNELFISRQAFIEVSNGFIFPIIITNTNYVVQRMRYLGNNLNIAQITFRIGNVDISNEGITPISKMSVLVNNDNNVVTDDSNNLIIA
jgi:hypothetical protein